MANYNACFTDSFKTGYAKIQIFHYMLLLNFYLFFCLEDKKNFYSLGNVAFG